MKKGFKSTKTDMEGIVFMENWFWPEKDKLCWPWLTSEHDLPEKLSQYCKTKRTIIEAGGNAGFYVHKYSEIFENVITFEPDSLNFKCLILNTPNENVVRIQACLGDQREFVRLHTSKKNIGSYHVDVENKNNLPRNIPTLLIDDLNSQDCDLIHLDIEGFELPALRGAVKTIERCKPVIAVEWMNHGEKFGYTDEKIMELLTSINYTHVGDIYNDKIFIHNDHI